jgi:formylglycine-generating enzyme required for sulfatase activity
LRTGDEVSSLRGAGNFGQGWDDEAAALAPVGNYRASPFGLHDVLGDVWEWCGQLPEEAASPARTFAHAQRFARGGGWRTPPDEGRSAARGLYSAPNLKDRTLGLRPGREPTGPENKE